MKKRYKVRFYKAHDLDLITYMASHTINIRMTLYYVFRAYCNGQVVGIRIPDHTGQKPSEYKKIYYTDLSLDTEKDKKMIQFMEGIKPGFRNNFLKNLLRQYLCSPLVEDFLVDPADYLEVKQTTSLLQGNRSMVDLDYNSYKKRSSSKRKYKKVSKDKVKDEPLNEKKYDMDLGSELSTGAAINEKTEGIPKDKEILREKNIITQPDTSKSMIKDEPSKESQPNMESRDQEAYMDDDLYDDLTEAFSQILSMQ